MSLPPNEIPGSNWLTPPNISTSPVSSIWSSESEDGIVTSPETGFEIDSPQIYDAYPTSVSQEQPSHTGYSSHAERGILPKIATSSSPFRSSFWDHPLVQKNPNIGLFLDRTKHLDTIFELSANRIKPIVTASINDLMRNATWWFIHGEILLQSAMKHASSAGPGKSKTQSLPQKAQTNISKALWILQKTIPQLPYNIKRKNESRLEEYQYLLLSKICRTIESMIKHGLFPEDNSEAVFSPDNDGTIWIEYPSLGINISFLLTGHMRTAVVDNGQFDTDITGIMPLGQSKGVFYYTTLSVDVYIFNDSSNSQQVRYPALLSVVRAWEDSQISIVLASQDGQIDVCVKPDKYLKSTWDNVIWLGSISSLEIKLPTGFRIQVRCEESGWETLSRMYEHHNTALAIFERGVEEQLIFETEVEAIDEFLVLGGNPSGSEETTHRCRLRLFRRTITRAEGTGPRKMYRGSRLAILTSTTTRDLHVLEYDISPGNVIETGFVRERNTSRSICLRPDRNRSSATTVLTFSNAEQCNLLLAHLKGYHVTNEEHIFADVQLNRFSLAIGVMVLGHSGTLGASSWQRARVINSKPWHDSEPDTEFSTTVLSESLRIVLGSPDSCLTDPLNLGIGELKIRRNVVASGHELHILREPQKDITYSQSVLEMTKEDYNNVTNTLSALQTQPSIRTFTFHTLSELHQFQAAITGFSVLFDKTPASFSISRRRLLVPNSKGWEAPHTRIQLLRRKNTFQLVAFFEGFKHGKCMNFVIRKTDSFKMTRAGNKILLRLVDAKFSLPSGGHGNSGVEEGFVCLDSLDYPSENNDITIGFESYSDYSLFAQALPGPVKTR